MSIRPQPVTQAVSPRTRYPSATRSMRTCAGPGRTPASATPARRSPLASAPSHDFRIPGIGLAATDITGPRCLRPDERRRQASAGQRRDHVAHHGETVGVPIAGAVLRADSTLGHRRVDPVEPVASQRIQLGSRHQLDRIHRSGRGEQQVIGDPPGSCAPVVDFGLAAQLGSVAWRNAGSG